MSDSGSEKKIKDVFSNIGKTVQAQAEIAKLRLQIKGLEGQKKELYQKIGEKVYSLFPKGLVKNSALISLCEEIEKLDEEIKAKLETIDSLQKGEKEEEIETEVTETEEEGIEEEIEE